MNTTIFQDYKSLHLYIIDTKKPKFLNSPKKHPTMQFHVKFCNQHRQLNERQFIRSITAPGKSNRIRATYPERIHYLANYAHKPPDNEVLIWAGVHAHTRANRERADIVHTWSIWAWNVS